MSFPDVIYNAGSPEKLAVSKEIIEKLKKEIPFTTHSIGNKWNVMERLKAAKEFANYLIPTEIVKIWKYYTTILPIIKGSCLNRLMDVREGNLFHFENGQ